MGLVIKLKKNQRVFFGDVMLEIDYRKGQVKLYIDAPKNCEFKITREDLEAYKKRMEITYKGVSNGDDKDGLCNMHSVCVSASAR